jgi:hypothetical protein
MGPYVVLKAKSTEELERRVNEALEAGAQLAGPLIHCPSCSTYWFQPVLYPAKSLSEKE